MSSFTRKLQQRMDGNDEPDRDDIDEQIALRKARSRVNLTVLAKRLAVGESLIDAACSIYGVDVGPQLAADIRRTIT